MPKPREGETREEFIKRAIPRLMEEGLPQKQAVGKAEGMADQYFPKSKKTVEWKQKVAK